MTILKFDLSHLQLAEDGIGQKLLMNMINYGLIQKIKKFILKTIILKNLKLKM